MKPEKKMFSPIKPEKEEQNKILGYTSFLANKLLFFGDFGIRLKSSYVTSFKQ